MKIHAISVVDNNYLGAGPLEFLFAKKPSYEDFFEKIVKNERWNSDITTRVLSELTKNKENIKELLKKEKFSMYYNMIYLSHTEKELIDNRFSKYD